MNALFFLCLLAAQPQERPPLSDAIDSLVPQISGYRSAPEAGLVDDGEFLRRVMLDLLGAPPSFDELIAFISDEKPGKRAARIDELLASPRFNDFWSRRLAELLLGNYHDAEGGAAFARWLRERLEENSPWTDIVHRLIVAEGRLSEVPELAWKVAWWREGDQGATITTVFSRQVFGINLFCARCHDHGFDKWRVEDFHELAAFTRGRKVQRTPKDVVVQEDPFSPADHVFDPWEKRGWGKTVKMPPRLFGGEVPPEGRKLSLSLSDAVLKQPYVGRAFVNRVWAWLMGRGLVHPVDEFDLKNKPLSPALLRALEADFRVTGSTLRPLIRAICLSRAYQRRSQAAGPQIKVNYNRAVIRPLSAEQLLASLQVATRGAASDDRVETHRVTMLLWGRPGSECETTPLAPDARVLEWLSSGDEPRDLLRLSPVLRRLKGGAEPTADRIERLFLGFLSRLPSREEAERFSKFLGGPEPDWEAAAWVLVNSTEFVTRH